jgi:hypothetical protein
MLAYIQLLQHQLHLLQAEPPRRLPGFQAVRGRHQLAIHRDAHLRLVDVFLAGRRGAPQERRGHRVARDEALGSRSLGIRR